MKTIKYKFSQEFTEYGLSRWLTSYAVLEPGEDPIEGAKKLIQQSSKIISESVKEQKEVPVVQSQSTYDQMEEDFKFNDVKKKLAEFEFREDAQAYLDTTEYSYTIEAKKIVNSKPNK